MKLSVIKNNECVEFSTNTGDSLSKTDIFNYLETNGYDVKNIDWDTTKDGLCFYREDNGEVIGFLVF